MVANLSAYYRANPPAILDGDHDPDGVPYAVVIKDGYFYVLNANHSVLDQLDITLNPVVQVTSLHQGVCHLQFPTVASPVG